MGILFSKREILERVKSHYKLNSNAELAKFLGISASSLSNWYTRNTIDFELVFTKCEDIDLNWLVYGVIDAKKEEIYNIEAPVKVVEPLSGIKDALIMISELSAKCALLEKEVADLKRGGTTLKAHYGHTAAEPQPELKKIKK
jgi:Bacteriophage CI repressor helix-turn-helix domain.